MDGLFVFLLLLSIVSTVITAIIAIIKKIAAKPIRKTLKFTGLSAIVVVVSFIGFGLTYEEKDIPTPMDKPNTTLSTNDSTILANADLKETANTNIENTVEATEETETDTNSAVQNTKESENYKYSGDKLKQILGSYMSSKKDSDKNKLKQSDSLELYELILTNLKNTYGKSKTVKTSSEYNYFKDACSMYIELYANTVESNNLKEILQYAEQIYNKEQELNKLKNKYGENSEEYYHNFYYELSEIEIYVIKKLDSFYGDTITGKILKEIDAYKQSTPTQFLASTDYTKELKVLGCCPNPRTFKKSSTKSSAKSCAFCGTP